MTRTRQAARLREAVVPDWQAEVVRLRRAPVPWADMIRAACAICVPLAVAIAAGQRAIGLLVAMGGLLGTVVDKGGPYAARVKRVAAAAVCRGAPAPAPGAVRDLSATLGAAFGTAACANPALATAMPQPTPTAVNAAASFRPICRTLLMPAP